jgi:hypothetical protein
MGQEVMRFLIIAVNPFHGTGFSVACLPGSKSNLGAASSQ